MTIMQKKIFILLILFISGMCLLPVYNQEDYLKISANVEPAKIKQGNEGVLKIKITPKNGIKISSHPEFMIKLDKNNDLSFSKLFFTASELDFETKQENGAVLLELGKEVDIRFKVSEDSLIGTHTIKGEVVFTAVFKDNWSLKTYQKFNVDFTSQRYHNPKKSNKK
jgi:hypothetical protein